MYRKVKLFVCFIALIVSCKKYDEGPCFSLRSKKARITNEWKIEKEYIGSNLSDPFNENFVTQLSDTDNLTRINIMHDQTVEFNYFKRLNSASGEFYYFTGSGTWEFTDGGIGAYSPTEENLSKNEGLSFKYENSGGKKFKIVKLTKKELWIFCFQQAGSSGDPFGHGLKLKSSK